MIQFVVAALAGGFSVASFAPLELWWLMPICVGVFYSLIHKQAEYKRSFLFGFIFGLFQFGIGASWVYVSLKTYGNMPAVMASVGVFFFVSALAFFNGLLAALFTYLRFKTSNAVFNAILFSALWVIAEWLRSVVLTGFPWLDVGYSQTTQALSGYAAIGSVYLVSFATVLCAVLLYEFANGVVAKPNNKNTLVVCSLLPIAVFVSGIALKQMDWTKQEGQTKKILLVQGNVPINDKWVPRFQDRILKDYANAIADHEVDLVVMAETAIPLMMHQLSDDFWPFIRAENKAILSGVVERDLKTNQLHNTAVLQCGENQSVYRKRHLVPFGEYLPLRFLFGWVLDYLQLPMSDFSAGEQGQNLECDDMQISLSICYEDAFAYAWFGDSLASHQRVQMSQMRAQETGRPMIRVGNSGPSSSIDYKGNVETSTGQFIAETRLVEVSPRSGKTPFIHFGLWIVWLSIAIVLLQFVNIRYKRASNS